MARVITGEWREALAQVSECKIIAEPVVNGKSQIMFLLQDPAGQECILEINAVGVPSLSGNILVVDGAFSVRLLEPTKGERFRDTVF